MVIPSEYDFLEIVEEEHTCSRSILRSKVNYELIVVVFPSVAVP